MSSKQDCSLFFFGSDQKKRPDNLIIGRNYNGRVLDMFEFGVTDYTPMEQFKPEHAQREMKPLLIF